MARLITTCFLAFMCFAPMHNASAMVIRMEISGYLDCGVYEEEEIGRGDYGCEQFADYFDLDFEPNEQGGWADSAFVIRFKVDLAAPPTDSVSGKWFVGDWVSALDPFVIERESADYFPDCDGDFAIAVDFGGPTFLCPQVAISLSAPIWQQVAQLSAGELASFRTSSSGDFILRNGNIWSGGYSMDSIRRISSLPEPGPLALLGMGLAGLGLSRRRKAN